MKVVAVLSLCAVFGATGCVSDAPLSAESVTAATARETPEASPAASPEHDVPREVREYEDKNHLTTAAWFSKVYQVEVDPELIVIHTHYDPDDEGFGVAPAICTAYADLIDSREQRLLVRSGWGTLLARCE